MNSYYRKKHIDNYGSGFYPNENDRKISLKKIRRKMATEVMFFQNIL